MKIKNRFLLTIILGLLALAFCIPTANAQSPVYADQALNITVTNGPAAGTNINVVLDVRKQSSVAIQVTQKSSATNATTTGFWIEWSTDGSKYGSGRFITTLTGGTTEATTVTNLTTYGAGYMRIPYYTNINDVAGITNLSLRYAIHIP